MRDAAVDKVGAVLRTFSRRAMLALLYDVQEGRCAICGKPMAPLRCASDQSNPLRPTVEHVVPTTMGGFDGRGNLFADHARCNSEKGGRWPNEQEVERLRDVNLALGWPNRRVAA